MLWVTAGFFRSPFCECCMSLVLLSKHGGPIGMKHEASSVYLSISLLLSLFLSTCVSGWCLECGLLGLRGYKTWCSQCFMPHGDTTIKSPAAFFSVASPEVSPVSCWGRLICALVPKGLSNHTTHLINKAKGLSTWLLCYLFLLYLLSVCVLDFGEFFECVCVFCLYLLCVG